MELPSTPEKVSVMVNGSVTSCVVMATSVATVVPVTVVLEPSGSEEVDVQVWVVSEGGELEVGGVRVISEVDVMVVVRLLETSVNVHVTVLTSVEKTVTTVTMVSVETTPSEPDEVDTRVSVIRDGNGTVIGGVLVEVVEVVVAGKEVYMVEPQIVEMKLGHWMMVLTKYTPIWT